MELWRTGGYIQEYCWIGTEGYCFFKVGISKSTRYKARFINNYFDLNSYLNEFRKKKVFNRYLQPLKIKLYQIYKKF